MILTIENVSRMFRVPRLRLWWYERLGLVRRRHRFGQGFVYGWEECARLSFLIKAQRVGVSAAQLAPLIKAAEAGAARDRIRDAQVACGDLIERLDLRVRALQETLAEIKFFCRLLSDKLPPTAGEPGHDRSQAD